MAMEPLLCSFRRSATFASYGWAWKRRASANARPIRSRETPWLTTMKKPMPSRASRSSAAVASRAPGAPAMYRPRSMVGMPIALLRRPAPVDHELAARDEGRLVGGEVEDAVRHLVGLAVAAEGNAVDHTLVCRRVRASTLGHGGDDGSGVDGVASDALPGVLERGQFGQEPDGALGSLVGRAAVPHAHEPELGRDVDDGAAARAPHGGHGGLGPEEDALGVDVHHAVPRLGGGVLEPARPADARVVDEDVEPPEAADRGLDGALPVRLAGDVELDEERLAPLGLDVGLDGLALRLQDVADGDRSAFAREQPSLGRSHAARGAADEGGLARQAHGDQLPGGRYPAPCASSMASKPSSGDMRAEVFRSFTAPLPMIAMETAAALTLLGTSKITTTS